MTWPGAKRWHWDRSGSSLSWLCPSLPSLACPADLWGVASLKGSLEAKSSTSREEGDGKSMNNKTSSLQREPQARTGSAVSHTDFTNGSEMYLLNGWFIMISFVDSEFVEINMKSKDKVAWNKAKLKGLNKRREISSIFKITLYLWQTNDQMYCVASWETGSTAWVKYTIRESKVPFLKRCSDKVRALSIWGDFFLFLEGRLIKTKGH